MICGRGRAATVGLYNDMRQYINNIVCYQYCIHYHYELFTYACVSPLIYIAMDCIMCYVFSVRVFKQMGAHTRAPSITRIHSFF